MGGRRKNRVADPSGLPVLKGHHVAGTHSFDEKMECSGCGVAFRQHQAHPSHCPKPVRRGMDEALREARRTQKASGSGIPRCIRGHLKTPLVKGGYYCRRCTAAATQRFRNNKKKAR